MNECVNLNLLTIYKFSQETAYISFGGLLMRITSEKRWMGALSLDDRVYLLVRKLKQ